MQAGARGGRYPSRRIELPRVVRLLRPPLDRQTVVGKGQEVGVVVGIPLECAPVRRSESRGFQKGWLGSGIVAHRTPPIRVSLSERLSSAAGAVEKPVNSEKP